MKSRCAQLMMIFRRVIALRIQKLETRVKEKQGIGLGCVNEMRESYARRCENSGRKTVN